MSAVDLYIQASDIRERVLFLKSNLSRTLKDNQDYEHISGSVSELQDAMASVIGECQRFMDDIDEQGGPKKVDYDASYAAARE